MSLGTVPASYWGNTGWGRGRGMGWGSGGCQVLAQGIAAERQGMAEGLGEAIRCSVHFAHTAPKGFPPFTKLRLAGGDKG